MADAAASKCARFESSVILPGSHGQQYQAAVAQRLCSRGLLAGWRSPTQICQRRCSHRGQIRVRTELSRPQREQVTVTESALHSALISCSSIASIACRRSLLAANTASPNSKGNRPSRSRISHPLAIGKHERVATKARHAITNSFKLPIDDMEIR